MNPLTSAVQTALNRVPLVQPSLRTGYNIFVYGTLKRGKPNHYKMAGASMSTFLFFETSEDCHFLTGTFFL